MSLWASLGGNLGEITDDGSVGLKVEEGRGGGGSRRGQSSVSGGLAQLKSLKALSETQIGFFSQECSSEGRA